MKDRSVPNALPYWMPNALWDGELPLPSQREQWDKVSSPGVEIPGLLAKLADLGKTDTSNGGLLANLAQLNVTTTPVDTNVGIPAIRAPSNNVWETPRYTLRSQ
jgi:hypothetical protein